LPVARHASRSMARSIAVRPTLQRKNEQPRNAAHKGTADGGRRQGLWSRTRSDARSPPGAPRGGRRAHVCVARAPGRARASATATDVERKGTDTNLDKLPWPHTHTRARKAADGPSAVVALMSALGGWVGVGHCTCGQRRAACGVRCVTCSRDNYVSITFATLHARHPLRADPKGRTRG